VKRPGNCKSIEDMRRSIEALDREIIQLIGRRAGYVEATTRFKTGEQSFRAPERERTMLEARRRWAEENGLDPGVIEILYRDLVSYFVDREMDEWRKT
jgi:isochorismate pyruvate lyase